MARFSWFTDQIIDNYPLMKYIKGKDKHIKIKFNLNILIHLFYIDTVTKTALHKYIRKSNYI